MQLMYVFSDVYVRVKYILLEIFRSLNFDTLNIGFFMWQDS